MKDTECSYCGTIYIEPNAVQKCGDCGTQWCNGCMTEMFCPECVQSQNPYEPDDPNEGNEDGTFFRYCKQCQTETYAWKEVRTEDKQELEDGVPVWKLEKTEELLCITCGHIHETETTTEVLKHGNN